MSLVQAPVQREQARRGGDGQGKHDTDYLEGLQRRVKDVDGVIEEAWQESLRLQLHASIDKRHKLVRKVIITNAAVSDSVAVEELSIQQASRYRLRRPRLPECRA
jgi:hypothetical protein